MVMALAFALFVTNQYDPDFWWSIRIGQLIMDMGRVPHHLPWTFTAATHTFIAQEWGSEVIYALLWMHGGMIGVILLTAAVTWVGLLAAMACIPRSVSMLGRVLAVLLLLVAGDATWGPRAQMFTFAGVGVVFWVLRTRWNDDRWRWSLVPIIWFWSQVHGGFSYGLGVFGVYLVGATLQTWFTHTKLDKLSSWWRTFAASVLVVGINPNWFGVYVYVFKLLHDKAILAFYQEWQSPNFHDPRMWALLIIIFLIASAAWTKRLYRTDLAEALVLAAAAFWAFDAIRNVADFCLIVLPFVAVGIDGVFLKMGVKLRAGDAPAQNNRSHLLPWVTMLIGLVLAISLMIPQVFSPSNEQFSSAYPVSVADWVCAHPQITRLYGSPDWNGWLLSAIDPTGTPAGSCTSVRVEMFGELPTMGDPVIYKSIAVAAGNYNALQILQQWRVQAAWVYAHTSLAELLTLDPTRWQLVMHNGVNEIFVLRSLRLPYPGKLDYAINSRSMG